jgi:hypothetical protein
MKTTNETQTETVALVTPEDKQKHRGLAENLSCAVIGYYMGIRPETVRKKYAGKELGDYWYFLAKLVARHRSEMV